VSAPASRSLLEALVFGRRAGKKLLDVAPGLPLADVDEQRELGAAEREIQALYAGDGSEQPGRIREELKQTMTSQVGVYRNGEDLAQARVKLQELRRRFAATRVVDKGKRFNLNLVDALELSNMLEYSELIVSGAIAREECRGAHYRTDFERRDDENWLKHTLAFRTEDGGHELRYKPVTITRFQPEERKY
jgi:succinate dehydrogenase / fumarate reductase flavoprotein subunit